jgi:hypothetical protein
MSWTSGSGSVSPGVSWEWNFSWGGNGDQGPQLIQAHPLSPFNSGDLATIQIAEDINSSGNLFYTATLKNEGKSTIFFNWRGGGV